MTKRKNIVAVYLSNEEYEALRKAAYEQHRKMTDILREGLTIFLSQKDK